MGDAGSELTLINCEGGFGNRFSGFTGGLSGGQGEGPGIVVTANREKKLIYPTLTSSDTQISPAGRLGEKTNAVLRPITALKLDSLADEAILGSAVRFPNAVGHNDRGDAFRHFYLFFALTQDKLAGGVTAARIFGDAHEVSYPNDPLETAFDLHNNAVARKFGTDPRFRNLSPSNAFEIAFRHGCLQTSLDE